MRDRFGDYGLVGVMIFRREGDVLLVDTFLLSCRALGRRVEHRMKEHLEEMRKRSRPFARGDPVRPHSPQPPCGTVFGGSTR